MAMHLGKLYFRKHITSALSWSWTRETGFWRLKCQLFVSTFVSFCKQGTTKKSKCLHFNDTSTLTSRYNRCEYFLFLLIPSMHVYAGRQTLIITESSNSKQMVAFALTFCLSLKALSRRRYEQLKFKNVSVSHVPVGKTYTLNDGDSRPLKPLYCSCYLVHLNILVPY